MLTDRIRVLPPFDSRGTIIYHLAIGVLVGILGRIFYGAYITMLVASPFPRTTAFALSLGIPAILAWRLAGRVQHWPLILACGLAYGASRSAGEAVWSVFERPLQLRAGTIYQYWPLFSTMLAWSALRAAIVFYFVYAVFRRLRYRVVTQDGTLCDGCGHNIGDRPSTHVCPRCGFGPLCGSCGYTLGFTPASKRCPECGVDISGPRKQALSAWLREHVKRTARPVAAFAALATVAFVIFQGHREQSDFAPLFAGVAHDEIVEEWMWGLHPQAGGTHFTTGVRREVVRGSGIDLYVLYEPNPNVDVPPMQLRLLTPHGREIVAHLTAEQAQGVLAHDVPESLIEEMLRMAEAEPESARRSVQRMSPQEVRQHFGE